MSEQEANVIVAIPKQDDYVWKISSEKVPHMTLLYLEDLSKDPYLEQILGFVQHAAETSLRPFYAEVERRGMLGADDADVLFFQKRSIKQVASFREQLLQNDRIRQAYNSVTQFPEWTPHLTLGYPTSPAHEDTRDFPGVPFVQFDRIALWTATDEGPEFVLQYPEPAYDNEMAMSEFFDDILEHHGIKGQKWGVRRDRATLAFQRGVSDAKTKVKNEIRDRTGSPVVVRTKPGAGVRTVGGNKLPAHADAIKARTAEQVAKRSTLDALSNHELQHLVTRMNLEQQYRNLASNEDRRSSGEKLVGDILDKHGSTAVKKMGKVGPIVETVAKQAKKNANKAANSGTVQKKKK